MTGLLGKTKTRNWGRATTTALRGTVAAIMLLLLTFSVVLAEGTPNDGDPGLETDHSAIISNGTLQLGVRDEGHLNVSGGGADGLGWTTIVGLRYLPTNGESTSYGCLCEGWGVADAGSGHTAWADAAIWPYVSGMSVDSFTSTASDAVSVVTAFGRLRVTHDYHPSPDTPYLYEVTVTIENISAANVTDLRYTRAMDWDIYPTPFSEYVTIQGSAAAANVLFASDNGFDTPDPLGYRYAWYTGDMIDIGPQDHGALFDFGFGLLPAGESMSFTIFYGAAGNETDALGALAAVGAEVYSFGQPSTDAVTGTPNTFIFAFSGVGGVPIGNEPPTADAGGDYDGFEGSAIALSGATAFDPDGDDLTYSWSIDTGLCSFDDDSALNPNLTCTDNGSFTATLSVSDGTETVTSDATVNVANVDPTITSLTAPAAH